MPTIGDNQIRVVQLGAGGAGGSGTWATVVLPNGDTQYTDGISGTSFIVEKETPVQRISSAQVDLPPGVYEIDSLAGAFTISLADEIGYWRFYNSNKSLDINAVTLTSLGAQTYTDSAGVQIDGDFLLNVGGKPVNILHTELGVNYWVSIEPAAAIPPLFAPNGGWDASTNTVDLNVPTNRVNGSVHYAYFVSATGTQNLGAGATLFQQGGRIEWYSPTQYNYIAPPTASSGWTLGGNNTTNQTTNFLGTIDNVGLSLRTNNLIRQTITNTGNVGIGTTTPNAPLQFANTGVNRKVVLFDSLNNDHEFYGLGINSSILRYQVANSAANHVFYAGSSPTTSLEIMRMTGTGRVGIGTPAPSSALDVNGSLILRTLTLADFPVSGSIGTAATTVDIYSTITLSQTTPNIVLTVADPTLSTNGRLLFVHNAGLDVHFNGHFLQSGTGTTFVFVNGVWRLVADGQKTYSTAGYVNPGGANSFSPNSGLNTIVGGVSTMPASTVNYTMSDGNYVGTISLPSAVGRIGRLSTYSSASSNYTVVTTNTDLDVNVTISSGRSLHFIASNGKWRWQPAPLATV